MIITISGTPGSGKSVVGRELASKLKYQHYSSGDFMRDMAEQKKISLLELSKIAEKDRSIDEEIDQRQIDLGMHEDNFVIDARLGFHFIPKSIKIFIDADFNIRAERIFSDRIRKEHNVNLENTKENIERRENSEKMRYQEYYNINPYNKENFNLIIDSSNISINDVVDKIIEFIEKMNL